ncbi:hypothetical protein PHLGIDRAFT_37430 [Phlebiopsis gigantea 11061_1 CR5-6]|uniref:HMA domain-containing protein n=1 Tax=Phlebiopsis gigantea (strain 11061_1 CR5-6) TaxID=745531 RepID=A0A0C3S1X4_PHLG1|nr:hypothetical protein PHLGIDRAFT_37430 [Phlebiopsis gigantea 11061_1 CR5-6]
MSPCCSGGKCSDAPQATQNTTQNTTIAIGEDELAEKIDCCTTTECVCDDQLARAICADDDGHVHTPGTLVDGEHIETTSLASVETCKCEDVTDNKELSESHASIFEGLDTVHSCGLRKRKAAKAAKKLPREACGEHKSLVRKRHNDTLTAFGSTASVNSCCADSCCGGPQDDIGIDDLEKQPSLLEKGSLDGDNHCVLAVKGMTCTGCENKLIRVLKAQPVLSKIKTSLVLSRAEFDYSCDPADLEPLIQTIQKRTGFTVEQIASTCSARALEFTVAIPDKMVAMTCPNGVSQVVKVGKNTVRVVYDPHVAGGREVIASYETCSPILAPEPQDPALTAGAKHIRMLLLRTVVSSLLTIPVLVMSWAPLPSHPHAYAIASLVLATLVQSVIAGPFYSNAFKSLVFSGLVETDLLVVLSTTTAYIYSIVAFAYEMIGHPLDGGSFFETSTLLVTLIMFGQLASALARQRAVAAISLRSLQQSTAVIVSTMPDGRTQDETIDVRLLQYNDTFRVLPDSVVITDGTITSGVSSVDESMMTGEAVPVEKGVGHAVLAGTRNGGGSLLVRATRLPGENTISDIADMVDDARFSRARIQGVVDRVCAWFVPAVLALAVITLVVWIAVGVRVRGQSPGEAAVRALTYAIAVLAISCPCAIGLAVPMVVLVASGVAARLGLVFKAATTIEVARQVSHAVFDKTGTLTTGQLEVVQSVVLQDTIALGNDTSISATSAILALVSASQHPVARAVAVHLGTKDIAASQVEDIEEVTSKGVQGTLAGRMIRGGNAKWLGLEHSPHISPLLDTGSTLFVVAYNGALLAVFALSDTIRPEVPALLTALAARGIGVSILSGDHPAAVRRVALALSIPAEQTKAGCLPADKAAHIRALQQRGAKVLFCGDGTNDAVALAQADVGVHMASDGAAGAAASAAADAVLLRPSLAGVGALLALSDAVHRRIVLNFAWAAVYNTVAVLFAAGAFVHARIAPAYAGLGEIVSVLPVVLIAMQLKWYSG